MRLVPIVGLACVISFLGFLFLRDQLGTAGEPTQLSEQVGEMVERWRIDGESPAEQLVTFVISDGGSYDGPLTVPGEPPEKP